VRRPDGSLGAGFRALAGSRPLSTALDGTGAPSSGFDAALREFVGSPKWIYPAEAAFW